MNLECPSPANINPLQANNFTFSVHKAPEITFFVQSANLPGLTLGEQIMETSVHSDPLPGDTVNFNSLTVTFIVDEHMKSYRSILTWMLGLGYPEGHQMFTEFINKQEPQLTELSKTVSDATLGILDSSNNAIATATFVGVFPVALSDIDFTTIVGSTEPVKATVTFQYSYFIFRTKYD